MNAAVPGLRSLRTHRDGRRALPPNPAAGSEQSALTSSSCLLAGTVQRQRQRREKQRWAMSKACGSPARPALGARALGHTGGPLYSPLLYLSRAGRRPAVGGQGPAAPVGVRLKHRPAAASPAAAVRGGGHGGRIQRPVPCSERHSRARSLASCFRGGRLTGSMSASTRSATPRDQRHTKG